MAFEDNELNKRQQRREEIRRKHQAEQRRLKIALIVAAVILVVCGAALFFIVQNSKKNAPVPLIQSIQQQTEETAPPTTEAPKSSYDPTITVNLRAAGDLNITTKVVESGLAAIGYDYTRAFLHVASDLSGADLTVMNFEGNVYGEPYGTETTSAPKEILDALRNAGVDMLQMANSCAVNNGLNGLHSTLTAIRQAGMVPLGAYSSPAEYRESKGYTICNVKGIKVAFVAFTKGLGGRGMPAGNEDCVNLLYTDYASTYIEVDKKKINTILDNVNSERPDITVAMLHWGSEYNDAISDTQKSIISLMQKKGVDIIIGSHPHLVQEIDYNPATGTLVAYSLGDFFGDATAGGSNYSIILDVELTKDVEAGTTRISNYSTIPIYTVKENDADRYRRVIRIDEAMTAYENNFVDKIQKTTFEDMQYSLTRIDARINPPKTEDD